MSLSLYVSMPGITPSIDSTMSASGEEAGDSCGTTSLADFILTEKVLHLTV